MTRQAIIDFCLTFQFAYEDYPFDGVADKDEHATAVMRHRVNKKSFALIMRRGGDLYLNLKCDPFEADFLRGAFDGVKPAYHMNKRHWNTVVIGSDVPDGEIKRQIAQSYDLIKPKEKTRKTRIETIGGSER
ncbi:MAG: MmcQ/YjbR family DNA-binding protein [Clostridiales bacterium]|jgi:predicted DNA-binding protein (MmcQ/YjbR family)|nr:MmcQ/YjbR family DNA-binding protein [Clostridiales bacterium]